MSTLDNVIKQETKQYIDNVNNLMNLSSVHSKKEKVGEFNRIIFGAPGTGKSHRIEKEKCVFGDNFERVTFHPNYSYAQFVGTYKPVKGAEEGKIAYKYIPGPFMRIFANAIREPEINYLLIIEEINRANVAAVFGDIFQLLDRKEGVSEYPISTGEDVREYLAEVLFGKKHYAECTEDEKQRCDHIRIPDNMYIWATMNSADQGVYPIDTAFKRRWNFEYIGIDDEEIGVNDMGESVENVPGSFEINGKQYKWNVLRRAINAKLSGENVKVHEDKLLGPFFLNTQNYEIVPDTGLFKENELFIEEIESKVLMYLFEDAAKAKKTVLFGDWIKKCDRYSYVCEMFREKGLAVFGADFERLYYDTQLDEYNKKIGK